MRAPAVRLREVVAIDRDQRLWNDRRYVGLEDIESGSGRLLSGRTVGNVKSTSFGFDERHVLYGRLRPYLNKVLLPDFVGHCSTEIFPLRPTADLDRHYLWYWLTSPDTVAAINATCTGARMPRANMDRVLNFQIPLPPLEEQRRMVAVLDEAFAAIATATANAEKNLANARELLDAEIRAAFSETGPGCEWLTLSEASIEFGRGKSKHRPRNDPALYGGPYPFIQTGDVRNCDHVIEEYSQTYNEMGLAQSKLWPSGTICITIAANIAETGILDFDACFPDSIIGMVIDQRKTSQHYVEYLLQSLRSVLQAKGRGSAQANINLATFENERLPFPPLKKQQDVADRLDGTAEAVRALEASYEQKLSELNALRKSLLDRAFSGNLATRDLYAA